MQNTFRYVFDGNLYNGFWQSMPGENGKRVFKISYPDYADQYGDFFEIIETGNQESPYKLKKIEEVNQFYGAILKWFSDHKLLSS
jgi:hypothetical protein